jgi:hypothetical protein
MEGNPGGTRSVWLAPVERIFRDRHEGDLFTGPVPFSQELEAGLILRSPTMTDQQLIDDWFQAFEKYVAQPEIESAKEADLLLRSDGEHAQFLEKVISFVLALSLHSRTPLAARALQFHLGDDGNVANRSGFEPITTIRLPSWDEAESMTGAELRTVMETYPHVARVRNSSGGMARSLGAYRAAITRSGLVDPVSILACASLEALVASDTSAVVIRRVTRYASSDSADEKLEWLYKHRHWFAHGATIPEMKEPEVRWRTLDEGLAVVKDILRTAYADEELRKAAASGVKAVKRYLGK